MTENLINMCKQALDDIAHHEHPREGEGADYFCLNLRAWLGERAGELILEVERLERERRRLEDYWGQANELAVAFAVGVVTGDVK